MQTIGQDSAETEKWKSIESRPRWHRIYLILAAFDIVTVLFSLIVSYRIVQIYRQSVADNLSWVEHLQTVNMISEQAAALNAPGNNVFETNDIVGEESKVSQESQKLSTQLRTFRDKLQTRDSQIGSILNHLSIVEQSAGSMTKEATSVFQYLRQKQRDEATRHMAVMDRHLMRLQSALDRVRDDIGAIQHHLFEQQTAQAAWLQRLEYLIGGLMILMVIAAVLYAQRIRRLAEWQQVQNDMMRAAEQRVALLKQVMLAHEDERRRIARELHDGIGQSLTSLLVGFRTFEDASSHENAEKNISELRRITTNTLDEVRQMARGLRPSVLDDLGLSAALERLVADFSLQHNLAINLHMVSLNSTRFPEVIETTLYRIIQEALTNVARHAHARKVSLTVERVENNVRAVIEDDGSGFDPDFAMQGDCFGLTSMKERAALHAGSFSIESQTGKGARVTVIIPVPELDHDEN